jgi:U2 small nuclear ribonucleoprotein A'
MFLIPRSNIFRLFLGRQHYRLYTIKHIPSLKVLDFSKITKTERERAERLAQSAAGAALEADVQEEESNTQNNNNIKTFVPGEGESAEESFVTNFTPEEKARIRDMVANAKSPAEIEEIERSVRRGILPKLSPEVEEQQPTSTSNGDTRKRPATDDSSNGNGSETKKTRADDGGE